MHVLKHGTAVHMLQNWMIIKVQAVKALARLSDALIFKSLLGITGATSEKYK